MTDPGATAQKAKPPHAERATISREELHRRISAGERLNLFEVLPEPYYRKHHLPGARLMLPTDVVATAAREVPDTAAETILYCWDDH